MALARINARVSIDVLAVTVNHGFPVEGFIIVSDCLPGNRVYKRSSTPSRELREGFAQSLRWRISRERRIAARWRDQKRKYWQFVLSVVPRPRFDRPRERGRESHWPSEHVT